MKKLTLKTSILIIGFILNLTIISIHAQTFVSKVWTGEGGEMAVFNRNAITTDFFKNVYVTGSTLNTNNSHDIIIQKFSREGVLIWQQIFNGDADLDDIASDIFVDSDYNIYITGTSVQNVNNNFDLVVLKYDSSGVLQWSYYYNYGTSLLSQDAGISIVGDNNGGIYVTGNSYGDSTLSDYVTLKLNSSNGNLVWEQRYDYAQLNDVPSKIIFNGVHIFVTGGSQVNALSNNWNLATIVYNASTGSQLFVRRSNGNSTNGLDEVYDLYFDNFNNIYVTGSVVNQGTGYDLSIYKLDNFLNIIWERHFDGFGLEDKGFGVKTDSYGNVYVAGYVSTLNEGKNYILLKYNSSGVLQWSREYNGISNIDDEAVQLVIDENNNVFVTGSAYNSNNADYVTLGYTPNGEIFTQFSYNGLYGLNDRPTAITLDLDGNILVVGHSEIQGGNFQNKTVKYKLNEKPFNPVMNNNVVSHNKSEVIIRFDKNVINYSAIDNKEFEAGTLKDFVTQNALTNISLKFKIDASNLETYKIFRRMTTADSVSVTRLGDTIKIDDFWATLSVFFPENMNEQTISDSLNTLKEIIHYAEPNFIGEVLSIPNDVLYSSEQTGLFNTTHGINIENAWGRQVGQNYVKVGVFDTGINWRHEDFGDGTWGGSKIAGGWDYFNNVHPSNQTTPDATGHGTACAGIIGALRNNNKGIAGIAGGDVQNNNNGVQILSHKIAQGNTTFVTYSVISSAIIEGAVYNPNTGFGYGLHVQSHSWGGTNYSVNLREAVKICNQNSCIFSVASGNTSNTQILYPASFNDSWVMKVGANDVTGERANFSTYGNSLDFIAPGTNDIYATLDHNNNSGYNFYQDGTSFACPHVSGVAALMYSQHHPLNNNFYPNVLAHEDVEVILQSFSTDVGTSGYDVYNGHGRINAGESLKRISLPYRIRHFQHTVSTSSATLHATNQSVTFPEGIPNMSPGFYVGYTDIYKVQVTLNHSIPSTETYLSGWVRNSVCDLYGITNTISHPHWSEVIMNSSNQNSATLTGYIYNAKIFDTQAQYIGERWFPVDLNSNVKFGYSIYTLDDDPSVGVEEIEQEVSINLFPNPTKNELTFEFFVDNTDIYLEIYDISGRKINSYQYDNKDNNVLKETIDVSKFSKGLYICKFLIGEKQITRKFIKN